MYRQGALRNNCFMLTDFSSQLHSWFQLMSAEISTSTRLLLINKSCNGYFWSTSIHRSGELLMIMTKTIEYCASFYKLFCVYEWFSKMSKPSTVFTDILGDFHCSSFFYVCTFKQWPIQNPTFLTGSMMNRIIGTLRHIWIRWPPKVNLLSPFYIFQFFGLILCQENQDVWFSGVAKIIWFLVLKTDGETEHKQYWNILYIWINASLSTWDFHWPKFFTTVPRFECKVSIYSINQRRRKLHKEVGC